MKDQSNGFSANPGEGERSIHSELWHACAGPLACLPPVGSLVVYFPQGHSEQVAASMQRNTDGIPSYPNLPSKLICILHHITLHANAETDEVYAQMTLQPVNKYDKEALLACDMGLKQSKQPAEFFCKILTASDTSTHGGFSVPRRAAEKIFPPLDFSMQPPARELVARDFHDVAWAFRHVYRGQPKRHLLTTGWSVFVSTKRLCAGDSVLFIRDEKAQLLLGIKRANRQLPALSSSVISSDSMHIGILAAAAHAAANNSPFTIFYNPRTSPSEFVVPLAKYNKAMYNQVSLGMRFRMMFETEESGVRRYMGTITGISDLDPVRWKNSQWRKLQVGWDESTAGARPSRVSIWEIEPVTTPFYICSPSFFGSNFSKQPGMPDDESDMDNTFRRAMPWIGDDLSIKDGQSPIFPGLNLVQWMSMQQNSQFSAAQPGLFPSMVSSASEHNNHSINDQSKILNFQSHALPASNFQFNVPKTNQQNQPVDQFQQPPITWPQQPRPTLIYPQQQQQHPQQQQHQKQQQLMQPAFNNNVIAPTQIPNQNLQQPIVYSQLHQKRLLTHNTQFQQDLHLPNQDSLQAVSLPQDLQFQIQMEHQQCLTQRQQKPPPQLQQLLTQVSPHLQPQLPQKQQIHQQNEQLQQQQPLQQQLSTTTNSSPPPLNHPQQFPPNHILSQHKPHIPIRTNFAPSCSAPPSTNNCQVSPSSFLNRTHQGPPTLLHDTVIQPAHNLVQELQSEPDLQVKHEVPKSKEPDQLLYRVAFTDPLEASLATTSYCLDGGSHQKNLSIPNFCFDGEVQVDPHNDLLIGVNVDGLVADTVLSRAFSSEKDQQKLLSSYCGTHKDLETEFSTAAMGSQLFGLPDMSFKPGLTDAAINESGVSNAGLWANQPPQHMRTFTKVQKRGSVGRSIDVTRYKGYDELRHDLAHMFGIEGQLEDPHRTEWKLVYMDHEHDTLLVGDDPWEEFVSSAQSIKILSSAEVKQMSLDGDLGHAHAQIHASSGSHTGNGWKGHNNVNLAALFDH